MNEITDFVILNRGRGRVLLFNGYQFYKNTNYKNGSYWRCKNYKNASLKCKGYIILSKVEDVITKNSGSKEHSCQPDKTQNDIDLLLDGYIDEAAQGKEPAPRVFRKFKVAVITKGLHLATNKPIPTFANKKMTLYRKIHSAAGVNKIKVKNFEDVEVPNQFQHLLLADYYDSEIKILIFASEQARSHFATLKCFFMDGTFKSAPEPFSQLYSIHGDLGSGIDYTNVIPLAYIFMSHKNIKAYMIAFELIKSRIPTWEPDYVNVDFEMAAITALSKTFRKVTINGCYFHFRNALKRKSKAIGLNTRNHRRIISLCCILSLLPINKIDEGWQYISTKEISVQDDKMLKFKSYFQKVWMKPSFIPVWCEFAKRHRTNNVVEAWNFTINGLINKHPCLLQILNVLNDDILLANLKVKEMKRFGKAATLSKRRKLDIEKDEFVHDAQMQLTCDEISVPIYLYKISLFLSCWKK